MEKFLDSTIMVVDDEPANLFFLEGLLEGEGYQTISAKSGIECLNKVKNQLPDVFLLDIMMPEMTGKELLKILNNDKKTKAIPVIMVSAISDVKSVEECLDLGAMDYVRKPIDEVELLARLRTALRLKKQEDKLRELLASKMEFIEIITHDLRTPFSSISGFAELLYYDEKLNKVLSRDHKDFLSYIINTSTYTVDYFNKLLNWANLGASDLKLMKLPIRLYKLIQSNTVIFKDQIEKKDLTVSIDIPETLEVEIDDTYFGQLIKNLISNAIKYCKQKGAISIYSKTENDHLVLIVEDNGIGMRENTLENVLNKTFQKSKRGTQGEHGTGIALAICKKIADAHGFKLTIKSSFDKGTQVFVQMNEGIQYSTP